jgi:hypothetical protein
MRWCVGGSHQCQQMDIQEVVLLPMPDRRTKCFKEIGPKGRQGANASYSRMQPRAFASLSFQARITFEEENPSSKSRISPFCIQIKQVPCRNPKDYCKTLAYIGISELPTPVSHHPLNRKTCPSSSPPCAVAQPPSQSAPSQRVNLPSSRA